MGDAMAVNDARVERKKFRKHDRRKERKRNEKKFKVGGGGEEGKGTKDQVQYPGFVETRKFRNSAKNAASVVRLGSVGEGIKFVKMLLTWKRGGQTCAVKRLTGLF
jgi:hypothetical protein